MKSREKLEVIEKQDKNKAEALEMALGRIEKDYGRGAVMRLGEISDSLSTECIPTGSLALDIAPVGMHSDESPRSSAQSPRVSRL